MRGLCATFRAGRDIACHVRQCIPIRALVLTTTLPMRTLCTRQSLVTDDGVHLVVGLGNPGKAFQRTRHNVGKTAIQHIAATLGLTMNANLSCGCSVSEKFELSSGISVIFATPDSFMNMSGIPVRLLSNSFRIAPENIIVVHDDVDIDFGRVKVKARGGSGGHNGLKSIIHHLGTSAFCRVKLGVGRPPPGEAMSTHVLNAMGRDMDSEVNVPYAVRNSGLSTI